jgi:uncharacterized protein YjbI with pentapeptide repeats
MTDKAPISDFNFGPDSQELIPFDVTTLLQEYGDGRRKFNQIDLKNGNLSHAQLPYIQLEESLLQKADLRQAIMAGASLNHIDLSSANLSRINLIAADLIRAKLAGANLTGAFLSGANLSGANLRKSNLTDCTLAGANLSGVDFTGAILKNTNMAGATLRGANLSAVDLSELDLTELNLEGSILPADHSGMTWAALGPGNTAANSQATTQRDSSLGKPADTPFADSLDESYNELIQDLAEAASWSEGLYANNEELYANNNDPGPFAVVEAPTDFSNEEGSPPSPFETASPDPFSSDNPEEQDELVDIDPDFDTLGENPIDDHAGLDTQALHATEGDNSTILEGPHTGVPVAHPWSQPPDFEDHPEPEISGDSVNSDGQLFEETQDPPKAESLASDPAVADLHQDAFAEPVGLPSSPDLQAKFQPQPSLPGDVGHKDQSSLNEDHATSETTILPQQGKNLGQSSTNGQINPPAPAHLPSQQRHELRQTPHQEEVIKTIQSALNRRTHLSLRRKLLEVYNKRCPVTDCNILPLLDTVLIDGLQKNAADHPSNGLVLRKDIKILYNLYLVAIDPQKLTVMLSPSLRRSTYGYLEGRKINLPKQAIYHPERQYLQAHLDQCKWRNYSPPIDGSDPVLAGPAELADSRSAPSAGWLTNLSLAVGGLVVGSLVTSLLWAQFPLTLVTQRPNSPAPEITEADEPDIPSAPVVAVKPEDRVGLGLGPLIYPTGGVIFEDSAYLALSQLREANLINSLDDTVSVIQVDGREFIKASEVSDSGVEVGWDADTRTVLLDCCEDPEIDPITVAVSGQEVTDSGLIINGSSFVPVSVFEALNVPSVRIPDEYFIGVDQNFYVKANELKPFGLELVWTAKTRTLNLVP